MFHAMGATILRNERHETFGPSYLPPSSGQEFGQRRLDLREYKNYLNTNRC